MKSWKNTYLTFSFLAVDAHSIQKRYNRQCKGTKLQKGDFLNGGDCINSPNRQYVLRMQYDGNLVIYGGENHDRAAWASDSANPRNCRRPYKAEMQHDGNLVIYGRKWTIFGLRRCTVWASETNCRSGNGKLVMQNDGNLVIYGGVLWASRG